MPTSTTPLDTRDMTTVHSLFRREIRLAGGVVRRVDVGDVRRARFVADHLEFLTRTLHNHHTGEDELIWPRLLERAAEEVADTVPLTLTLGMFDYGGDPQALARMLATAPLPVRWIVPKLSRRAFRKHALAIHGSATP